MAGRPGPAMVFGKWVIVPILVGLVGYYIVGPQAGKVAVKETKKDAGSDGNPHVDYGPGGDTSVTAPAPPVEKTHHQIRKKTSAEPDLDISVRPDGADVTKPAAPSHANASNADASQADAPAGSPDYTAPVKPTRHRRRPRPAAKPPADDANTPVVNQNDDSGKNDQGGSAGSTTAG